MDESVTKPPMWYAADRQPRDRGMRHHPPNPLSEAIKLVTRTLGSALLCFSPPSPLSGNPREEKGPLFPLIRSVSHSLGLNPGALRKSLFLKEMVSLKVLMALGLGLPWHWEWSVLPLILKGKLVGLPLHHIYFKTKQPFVNKNTSTHVCVL